MATAKTLASISRLLSNPLDWAAAGERSLAAVIGDFPSHYSKTPQLWNAAFQHLRMDAVYWPFDVDDLHVGDLFKVLRDCETFLGANVTVPHKTRVMEFLDGIDQGARRIQAVNTIVRTPDGKLIGFNTDGEGFLDSLLIPQPGCGGAFMRSLEGRNVLLLGAGGSARAVAFHLTDEMKDGQLAICNRTAEQASALAGDIQRAGRNAIAIGEEELFRWAPQAELIVNCTTKGQGGVRRIPNATATFLEPYSALAPAHPPLFPAESIDKAETEWRQTAGADIEENNELSIRLAERIPAHVGFYDLIYHPEETVFLRHGRLTGHPTMNGKAMIINQAVIAFCERICRGELQARAIATRETARDVLEVMYRAW
jgi:shikimate dehydrogenase